MSNTRPRNKGRKARSKLRERTKKTAGGTTESQMARMGGTLSLRGTDPTQQRPVIMREPMPNTWYVTLRLEDYGFQANAGALFQNIFYKMNGAFDPAYTGSLFMVPFAEYAAFSNTYRVINFRCKVQFMALETFPQMCVIGPSVQSLGTNNSLLLRYSSNEYWKKRAISSKGGMDRTILKTSINLPTYYGATQYMNDPAFAAGVGANPATILYFNFGTVSTNLIISGTEYLAQIEMDVMFYAKDMFQS